MILEPSTGSQPTKPNRKGPRRCRTPETPETESEQLPVAYLTVAARNLLEGDLFDLGAEIVTVQRVHQVRPSHVRVVGTMGYGPDREADLNLAVSLTVPAESSMLITRNGADA